MSQSTFGRSLARSLLAFAATAIAAAANAQGTVQGKIVDSTGAAVAGAVVTIDNTTLRATSAANGHYAIQGVPAGARTLRVRAIRYAPVAEKVTVTAGATVQQDFTLPHSVAVLASVEVVGSHAAHTAADELPVPVDIYGPEVINKQGSTETGQVLNALAPSVNFPHQSVTDANDIVKPFTMRGLSPDETLVLMDGWRLHQSALVNTFAYGSVAGASGVDLNIIPSSAIDQVQVLRDGASTQYGSDAIAGVVNFKMKDGSTPAFMNVEGGEYVTGNGYPNDGASYDINAGAGIPIGRGSLGLFGEYLNRGATNRAWPDSFLVNQQGVNDSIDPSNGHIIMKRTGIPQPNYHWGDGLEQDATLFANFRLPVGADGRDQFYLFGGYGHRNGTGNGYWRYFDSIKNWPEIYPNGFLPEYHPLVQNFYATAGYRWDWSGWATDAGISYGGNSFNYHIINTNNASLGPSLSVPTAPGPDGILGTSDDPGIPNQTTFDAGTLRRSLAQAQINAAKPINLGLRTPTNLALGILFQSEGWQTVAGEEASWVNGYHLAQDSSGYATPGSSVFNGFSPSDASNNTRTDIGVYADLEGNVSESVLLDLAARYENYSDFGSQWTGKIAARWQPERDLIVRGAVSTGFRAPGLSQSYFSHISTNVIGGQFVQVFNAPVTSPVAQLFGAQPLKPENAVNFSAGVAWTPQSQLTVTADYYYVSITNRILMGATFDGTSDTVVARVLTDAGYFSTIQGVQFFVNGLDTRTQGVTVTGNWAEPVGRGVWNFNIGLNYAQNVITKTPPLPPVLQGTNTTYTSSIDLVTQLAITKEAPWWKGTFTATYVQGNWHGLGRLSYFGQITSAQPSFTDAETYGAKMLTDIEIGYQFSTVDLTIGSRNLFNVYPDQMTAEYNNNDNTFPWAAASPFGYDGRYLYVRASVPLTK